MATPRQNTLQPTQQYYITVADKLGTDIIIILMPIVGR
jgi:hypothetical protein